MRIERCLLCVFISKSIVNRPVGFGGDTRPVGDQGERRLAKADSAWVDGGSF